MIGPLLRSLGLETAIRQYVTVGLRPNELDVRVTLERRGCVSEISSFCSVASLRPLRLLIASSSDAGEGPARLSFKENGNVFLGSLKIRPAGRCGPRASYRLYSVVSHQNACVKTIELGVNYLRYEIERLKRVRDNDQFRTAGLTLWSLLTFYTRPRPVVIVSIADDGPANLFPMDLLGAAEDGAFLMALRSTSPNVQMMRRTRRIAMCEVPLEFKEDVYALASGHKRLRRIGEGLPFDVVHSPAWRLPLPMVAIRLREVEVTDVVEVGSHHLFTTRVVSDAQSPNACLHHVTGFYERALRKRGRALATA
jgi:flavin reductase (DIM6/NTAB) family NADH-FMN oxidoreductase RutF